MINVICGKCGTVRHRMAADPLVPCPGCVPKEIPEPLLWRSNGVGDIDYDDSVNKILREICDSLAVSNIRLEKIQESLYNIENPHRNAHITGPR